jgi:hypothetical protein
MRRQFLATALVTVLLSTLFSGAARADKLTGFSDVTVVSDAIVSLQYDGTEYVVANGDLMLGTTTRWYIPTATGIPTLWKEGDPTPAATNNNGAPPKPEDPGSEGDNFFFRLNGANNMSSIDAIDFQETIFPVLTDTIFVFERGGNDTGTYQAILADGSLGAPVPFVAANVYKDTGVDVAGQNAFGVVFTTDVRVKGVRITAPGHDCLSISAIPKPTDPKQSHDPQPADQTTEAPRGLVLNWLPGEGAVAHDVYLGTSLAEVSDASRADPRGVLISQGLTAETYDPASLEFGRTYYWRVDEVGGAAPFKGEVWSFTVEPYSYPIENVTATASSAQTGMGPENTVNGSGLNAGDEHSTEPMKMWLSTGAQPTWIQYEFDRVYKLDELWVWNANQLIESFLGFGAKDVAIEYSLDGGSWTVLAGVPQFAQAPGHDSYTHNTVVAFGGVRARYVKLTINANWGAVPQSGLSEVRFFYVPVEAREPVPANAATGVAIDATMSWHAGREAASHKVYVGQDKNAVANGTAPMTEATDPSFTPAALNLATTYYWRVDEVNEAQTPSVYEGPVWSFATQDYSVVDDFESYTDQAGGEIFATWVDGYGTTTNGSQVGNLTAANGTFGETQILHGGRQSMPLSYNNAGGFALSEAERTFETPQDWTRAGIATLAVYFRGDPNNTGGRLYLKINGVKVAYDGAAAALKSVSWTRWDVDLASVSTNLKNVTRLALGLDSGGTGIVYVDDIRLLPASNGAAIILTVGPADSVKATGNDGTVQSINGLDVSTLVLGTTTTDFEKYADHPAADADDFDLGTYASLDDSKAITVKFAVPVTTIFIIERGANDSGFIQPLDGAGQPIGEPQPFVTGNWFKPGVTISGQAAGAMVITTTAPISGITLLPPAGGVTGIDPASISGVPAK